jgi:hypothetical protein
MLTFFWTRGRYEYCSEKQLADYMKRLGPPEYMILQEKGSLRQLFYMPK